MKRSKFLAAFAAMFTVPFLSFGKGEKSTGTPADVRKYPVSERDSFRKRQTIIIRETTSLDMTRPDTHERDREYAMKRLLHEVERQVKEWETGSRGFNGEERRDVHFMTEVVILREDQKERWDTLSPIFKTSV